MATERRLLTNVRIDEGTLCTLLFAAQDDLVRFQEFCEAYQRSGFAEGRGVYWLDNLENENLPELSMSTLTQEVKNHLEQDRLERMALAIRKGRGYDDARIQASQSVPILTGTVDGAIGFLESVALL